MEQPVAIPPDGVGVPRNDRVVDLPPHRGLVRALAASIRPKVVARQFTLGGAPLSCALGEAVLQRARGVVVERQRRASLRAVAQRPLAVSCRDEQLAVVLRRAIGQDGSPLEAVHVHQPSPSGVDSEEDLAPFGAFLQHAPP